MPGKQDFNFVADGERPMAIAWVLLVLGAIAMAIVADGFAAASADNEQLLRQAERLQRTSKVSVSADRRKSGEKKSAVATRHDNATFPWDVVLTEVELAFDSRVALLSLDTEAPARRTRLTGEARTIDDALAFAGRLRESPLVREALLVSHEARKDGPVPVIVFTLQIDWSAQ
jgi:hypothetical protein